MIYHVITVTCSECRTSNRNEITDLEVELAKTDIFRIHRKELVASLRENGCKHKIEISERMYDW